MPRLERPPPEKKDDARWIYTYGDLMTLVLVFFVLLFSFCKFEVNRFLSVAESFKPAPLGSPYLLDGQPALLDAIASQAPRNELDEEITIAVDERGVVVSFQDTALFNAASAQINTTARDLLSRFVILITALSNRIEIEGHTDDTPIRSEQYPSNWELSSARAGAVARFLEAQGIERRRMRVLGYADTRPRVTNDTPAKRALNRRIDIVIRPDDFRAE